MSQIRCIHFAAAVAIAACSQSTSAGEACHDDECATTCLGRGHSAGSCEGDLCICTDAPDGDADADTDADGDGDGDVVTDGAVDGGRISPDELLTDECPQLYGVDTAEEALAEDTILLGAIHPLTGDLAILGPFLWHATELAVEEINDAGGIPGHRLAVLACNSGGIAAAQVVAATEHLVRRARVPAILGPFDSQNVMAAFDGVTRDAGVVIVTAGATSPTIESVVGSGLVWSTSCQDADLAHGIAEHLLDRDYDRVGVLGRSDPWGLGMREAMQDVYCTSDRCGASRFIAREYSVVSGRMTPDITDGLQAMADFGVDAVVLLSFIEDGVVALNEAVLGVDGLAQRFVTAAGLRNTLVPSLVFNELALCQLVGAAGATPSGAHYTNFASRYAARWGGTMPWGPATQSYDATYMLALAIAQATGDPSGSPLTGETIAESLGHLSHGEAVPTGPEELTRGATLLRASSAATIDYVGASGAVDFPEGWTMAACDARLWHIDLSAGEPVEGPLPPPYDPHCAGVVPDDE